jgi:uncharacterized integral membrane protein
MFWVMNACLLVAAAFTMKHDTTVSSRGIQLLSRAQTEEWKGWMQWAFIMYHYYRIYYVYNEIRVFVSAYVWMTGFGNFLYFDKKQDFSLERMVSMWVRINYFPLLLSLFLDVPLELYYVVPLHTAGFFITLVTCYLATQFKTRCSMNYWHANGWSIMICFLVHVIFYETSLVDSLNYFSHEYHFRFQADKYTALVGICSGFVWKQFHEYMQKVYLTEPGATQSANQVLVMWGQRAAGVFLIWLWYYGFGYNPDKYTYNPVHPYIFWIPIAGWLMLRNSSKYLTELHAGAMEFFGRITLETYVLQFHVFMCKNVQHIPVVLPGADANGPLWLKTANMLLCGCVFVPLAAWARKVTVATQTSVVELIEELRGKHDHLETTDASNQPTMDEEKVSFLKDNAIENGGEQPKVELV